MCVSTCVCDDVSKGALVSLVLFSEGLLCNSLESLTSSGKIILLNCTHAQTETVRYRSHYFTIEINTHKHCDEFPLSPRNKAGHRGPYMSMLEWAVESGGLPN